MEAHLIVVVYDGSDGGMEDGEQAQRCLHAVGAVPDRRCRQEVRCEQAEVMGVAEASQQRRRGPQDTARVSLCNERSGGQRSIPRRVLQLSVRLQRTEKRREQAIRRHRESRNAPLLSQSQAHPGVDVGFGGSS